MQLSFAPGTNRYVSVEGQLGIIDERIIPSCACQDAVQSKDADQRCTMPFAEQEYRSVSIIESESISIP